MRKIIIGDDWYNIIRWRVNLGKNEWASALPVSIRIKTKDVQSIKFFEGSDFAFKLIKEDGVYECESEMVGLQVLSKFPNGEQLCKIDLVIWEQEKADKDVLRDVVLNELLK